MNLKSLSISDLCASYRYAQEMAADWKRNIDSSEKDNPELGNFKDQYVRWVHISEILDGILYEKVGKIAD